MNIAAPKPHNCYAVLANGWEALAAHGKAVFMEQWQFGRINEERLRLYLAGHPDATNTGTRCGALAVADIDIVNAKVAEIIKQVFFNVLGNTNFVRVGSKGYALFYRNTTRPLHKIVVTTGNPECKVEFLAVGQQVIVDGIHPDTGKPYEWIGADELGEISPLTATFDSVPETTAEKIIECAHAVAAKLKELGYENPKVVGNGLPRERKPPSPSADEPVSPKQVEAMLRHISPECARTEGWLTVAGAVQTAPYDDPEFDPFPLFVRWSSGEMHGIRPRNFVDKYDCEALWNYDRDKIDAGEEVPGIGALIELSRAQKPPYNGPVRAADASDKMFAGAIAEHQPANGKLRPVIYRAVDRMSREAIGFRDSKQRFIRNPGGTCTQLIGAKKSFKTAVTQRDYMDLAIETGAVILYIALEGAEGIGTNDQSAILQYYADEIERVRGDLAPDEWLDKHLIVMDLPGFRLLGDGHVQQLVEIARAHNVSDTVIDTQVRATRGVDENSTQAMGEVSEAIDYIRRNARWKDKDGVERGCNVRVLHHVPKNPRGQREGRGSNVIGGDFNEIANVVANKKRGLVKVEISDRKGAPDGQVFFYRVHRFGLTERSSETGQILVPIDIAEYRRLNGKDAGAQGLFYEAIRAMQRLIARGWKDPALEGHAPIQVGLVVNEIVTGRGIPLVRDDEPPKEADETEEAWATRKSAWREAYTLRHEIENKVREDIKSGMRRGQMSAQWRSLHDPKTSGRAQAWTLRLLTDATKAAAAAEVAEDDDPLEDDFDGQ